MAGLEEVIRRLKGVGIVGELWVDGSFLTECIDPSDSDVVLSLDWEFVDGASEPQKEAIEWINSNLKEIVSCDSYILINYPKEHKEYWAGAYLHAFYMRQFGFDRGDDWKGIAAVTL